MAPSSAQPTNITDNEQPHGTLHDRTLLIAPEERSLKIRLISTLVALVLCGAGTLAQASGQVSWSAGCASVRLDADAPAAAAVAGTVPGQQTPTAQPAIDGKVFVDGILHPGYVIAADTSSDNCGYRCRPSPIAPSKEPRV